MPKRYNTQALRMNKRASAESIKGNKLEVIALHLGISIEAVKMQLDAVQMKLTAILSQETGDWTTNS